MTRASRASGMAFVLVASAGLWAGILKIVGVI
jgi:hypothetical protein